MTKMVVLVLKLDGNLKQGVRVTLTMLEEDNRLGTEVTGYLPPNPMLATKSEQWQRDYRSKGQSTRIKNLKAIKDVEIIPREQWRNNCERSGKDLLDDFNQWLLLESFRPIREICLKEFNRSNEVRLFIRTANQSLLKLPWHEWDFVEQNRQVEVVFCTPDSHQKIRAKVPSLRGKVKILAILGNSTDINVKHDRQVLENLPDVTPTFLVEPKRQELNDSLWEQPWDVLFFAGHSRTEGGRGQIDINQTDSLTIAELKYALRNAVDNGLQVAIFNSCDGMELALKLQELHIPLTIVMREPVPDPVAQTFATYFLQAFTSGKSLHLAAREARERLQGLENEFPCASWLPMIFQNPATVSPTWQQLGHRPSNICPYRGLLAFEESDALFYFGRKIVTKTLVEVVQRQSLVAVTGRSGSGKSSLVKAGLIPRLRRQGGWQIFCFRPGNNPLQNLAYTLISLKQPQSDSADKLEKTIQLADELRQDKGDRAMRRVVEEIVWSDPGTRTLLVVDQLEELYTSCQDEVERQVFLDRLLTATQQSNFTLVLTLRADFYDDALSYRPLSDALQGKVFNLGPMNRKELLDAIEQPAKLFGVTLEAGLSERIIEVVDTSEGKLPLLEFCLQALWGEQTDAQLTHAAYKQIGGVETSVANHAEQVYHNLNKFDQERMRTIFLRLVHLEKRSGDTKRLATRAEVGEENWDLVTKLAGEEARLLVTGRNSAGEETVEIVHEALIHQWSRSSEWVNGSREALVQRGKIERAASEWQDRGKARGYLLQGKPLKDANEFRKQQSGNLKLSPLTIEFIRKSNRQTLKNLFNSATTWLVLPIVIFLVVIFGFFLFAYPRLRDNIITDSWKIVKKRDHRMANRLGPLTGSCRETYNTHERGPAYHISLFSFGPCPHIKNHIPDLSGGIFTNSYFDTADFRGVNLSRSDFRNATLKFCDFRNADLSDADLSGADLSGADLSGAKLNNADLSNAKLNGALLNGASLKNTRFVRVSSKGALLSNANLSGANLSGANFSWIKSNGYTISTNLSNANFERADLSNANFERANLSNANFERADLSNANFKRANFKSTNLKDANLSNADLTFTRSLTPKQVKSARNYEKAKYDLDFRVVSQKLKMIR